MEIYIPTAVQGSVSGNFYQVLWWKLSDFPTYVTKVQILSVFLFFLSGIPLMVLALWNGKSAGSFTFDIRDIGIWFAVFASWPTLIFLHELVHGLTMRIIGTRPQYGVRLKQLLFYTTAPGYGFRRNAYIIVVLAHLALLSVLAILGMSLLQGTTWALVLAFYTALNIGGATGDLAIALMVLGFSEEAYFVDEQDGFRVLMRAE